MPKHENIRGHLPALLRPDADDTSVVSALIRSVGMLLDDLNQDMGIVMQSHWVGLADDARFSAYLTLDRLMNQLGPLNLNASDDRLTWDTFPYVHDLARMGALLALPPYRDPVQLKESVEAYRTRLKRYVQLYRNGLGTIGAIRAVVEMELPADPALPTAQRERSFCIEEFAPIITVSKPFESRRSDEDGTADEVGPLMRWNFTNPSMQPAALTLYLQGVAPEAGLKDPTQDPAVECLVSAADKPPIAVGYKGLLGPDEGLRLRPAHRSWLGTDSGLLTATAVPGTASPADPTAPGPWEIAGEAPEAAVTALTQTHDRILWMAVEDGDGGQLWRHDGITWQRVLETTEIAAIHCLAEKDNRLLVGTAQGLLQIDLYPAEGEPFTASAVAELAATPVHALYSDRNDQWWLGAENGLFQLNADDSMTALENLAGMPVYAIHQDRSGVFYFGGELGLFSYRPNSDRWAWYCGEEESDQIGEWNPLDDGGLPAPEAVFLPPVYAVTVGRDQSVWIGTASGFARYYARNEGGATYKTMLEAYPDLNAGRVFDIQADERGLIWLATQRGLFRYDGRDIAQYQSAEGRWVCMGRADATYEGNQAADRDAWRYHRSGSPAWQRFNRYLNQWQVYATPPRSSEEPAVRAVAWTDSLVAEVGTIDGEAEQFTPHPSGHPGIEQFVMRVKPDEGRIVTGGLPAVPRMPTGESTWRYLSLESEEMPISPNRPWWSREGRLFFDADKDNPFPARYGKTFPTASAHWFDEVVFAYKPAARLWFEWTPRQLLTTLVRLHKRTANEAVPPAVLDRVWQGIQRVRPAGVRTLLAVEQDIVRGGEI